MKPEDAFSVTGVYRGPAPSVYVLGIVWATVAIYALALAPSYNRVIRGLEEERRFFNPPAPGFAPQPAPPRVDTPPSPRKMAPRPAPSAPPPVDSSLADADRYFTTQPGGNMPADFPPNAPQATDAGS